jgi:transmembrane sensor
MSSLHEHPGLHRTAAQWVARLTSGHASPADVDAARAWCEQSAEHRAAFERARNVWQHAGHVPPAATPRARSYVAAAVLLCVAGVVLAAVRGGWSADFRTGAGEQRRVALNDGSTVLLDSGTAIDVQLTEGRRTIRLHKGQALFQVAPDVSRPFVVESASTSATAVGTVYAVRRDGDLTEVVVKEGVVAVAAPGVPVARVVADESLVHAPGSTDHIRQRVDTANALAWERGLLVYELAPLEQVVDEINRHRRGHILIMNSELRSRRVSGVFHIDQLDESLRMLESSFDVRVISLSPYLVMLR